MKILFISNLYPPNAVGGYERLCHDVATGFVSRGHEVKVLTSDFGDKVAEYPGQIIHRALRLLANPGNIYAPFSATATEREALNSANIAALREVLERERPDVVFAWNLFFLDASFLGALSQSGARVVFMLTDNWLAAALNGEFVGKFFAEHVFGNKPFAVKPPGWTRLLARPPRPANSLPHGAIFGAEFMRRYYAAAGIGSASSKVIHNGVRIDAAPDEAFVDRTRLCDPAVARLLFVGRVVELKGVHTAIDALALLGRDKKLPPLRLTILGDAQDEAYVARLRSAIAAAGIADRIAFAPPVKEDELFGLFQRHDIYVFPSLYEPFALTLIQALAAGIPTIASDAGGNVEIVRHSRTGLLFRKGDPQSLALGIKTLLGDGYLRRRLAANARRVASEFTTERMLGEMESYLLGYKG